MNVALFNRDPAWLCIIHVISKISFENPGQILLFYKGAKVKQRERFDLLVLHLKKKMCFGTKRKGDSFEIE